MSNNYLYTQLSAATLYKSSVFYLVAQGGGETAEASQPASQNRKFSRSSPSDDRMNCEDVAAAEDAAAASDDDGGEQQQGIVWAPSGLDESFALQERFYLLFCSSSRIRRCFLLLHLLLVLLLLLLLFLLFGVKNRIIIISLHQRQLLLHRHSGRPAPTLVQQMQSSSLQDTRPEEEL